MTNFPEPEGRKIPEGHYSFRVNKEPEIRVIDVQDKSGNKRESRKIVLYVVGINAEGEYRHSEGFVPWDERYPELLTALGVEHGRDIDVTDKIFEADIEYAQDKKDPSKFWPRLKNIVAAGREPAEGGDIPF